jgi:RNA polymerase sigma factor (sigma-70 family)
MNSPEESVTVWITHLKDGDQDAAQHIWERYCQRLIHLAARKFRGAPRRVSDEDDMVQAAFDSLYRGVEAGRFAKLDDRDDLWQLLVMITERKVIDSFHHERRQKRGGGNVRGESVFVGSRDDEPRAGIGGISGQEPTPDSAIASIEECQRLLQLLPDDTLREVATLKLEGWKNREIAEKIGLVEATVERKLKGIRSLWERELNK